MVVIGFIIALLASGEPEFNTRQFESMEACVAGVTEKMEADLAAKVVIDAKGGCVILNPAKGSI
jgi:hypothetical protein